jgi:4-carboxymuconolactone decarboxylase
MTELTPAQRAVGDVAPQLAALTDDVLFGQVWSRDQALSRRDRSLVTVASLVTSSSFEQLERSRSASSPRRKKGFTHEYS